MTKKFHDFINESNEITEDHREQCLEYKREAIDQAERIEECFEEMISSGFVYYGAKQVSRQLQDIADELENAKEGMEKNQEAQASNNPSYY